MHFVYKYIPQHSLLYGFLNLDVKTKIHHVVFSYNLKVSTKENENDVSA